MESYLHMGRMIYQMSESGISILIAECELSKSARLMTEGKDASGRILGNNGHTVLGCGLLPALSRLSVLVRNIPTKGAT
jgi:hypothetical protein